jgi:hypothetical protein
MDEIWFAIDEIFKLYSRPEHKETLIEAKKKYLQYTGTLDDESSEFENKMNCFNEWFVFNYQLDSNQSVLESFLASNSFSDEFVEALKSVRFSVFEYKGKNFRKCDTVRDLLTNKKIVLSKNQPILALLPGEYFSGRVLNFDGEHFLLKGVSSYPKEVNSIIKKQANNIKNNKVDLTEEEFLLMLEGMKNRAFHFSHLNPVDVFKF